MATSYTTLLGLALPVQGELQGTWGDEVNNYITNYLDAAVAGTQTLSADADATLTKTTGTGLGGTSSQYSILLFSGSRAAQRTVTVPAASKSYVVINATTGGFAVKVVGAGPTTGVTIANGEKAVIAWNGSDFVKVSTFGGSAEFTTVDTTNLEVTNIKAKDGTASATIADSTGVMTIASSVLTTTDINGGTIDGVTIGGASAGVGTFTTLNATTLDLTNLEVTNIKAKDGTASASIANSTGVMTLASAVLTTADINGGTIDGTAIGAASASTGAFTTLAASGAVTLSGGTANGVAYLDGSKVVTTGSALTFDGTTLLAQGGVTTAIGSGGNYLLRYTTANINSRTWRLANDINAFGDFAIQQSTTQTGTTYRDVFTALNDGTQYWSVGGSEQMRLTSTGLGIGTSSPAYKLDVAGTINSGASAATGYNHVFRTSGITTGRAQTSLTNTSGDFWTGIEGSTAGQTLTGSAAYSAFAGTFTANPLYLVTSGSIRATLDSSGNLGLGVTPSAWSGRIASQVYSVSLASPSGSPGIGEMSTNRYLATGGTDRYIYSAPAMVYQQGSGAHKWYTAPSGTAGDAISFSQVMTLDSSGNLGLGVTPSAWWSAIKPLQMSGNGFIGSASNFTYVGANFFYNSSADPVYVASAAASLYEQGTGAHRWYNAPSGTAGNAISFTQAMTLDASGNLGIGTSSPSDKLDVFGGKIRHTLAGGGVQLVLGNSLNAVSLGSVQANGDASLAFYTNTSTERMRLDSSGNLGLGVTPSAWGSGYTPIQGAGYSLYSGNTVQARLSANEYINSGGSPIYRVTGAAAVYQQSAGTHAWFTAPSGTAGNAISFTQAMTLTSGGDLLVGGTADEGSLVVIGNRSRTDSSIRTQTTGSTGFSGLIADGAGNNALIVGTQGTGGLSATNGGAVYTTQSTPLMFGTGNTERARITSGGDLLVGLTTPTASRTSSFRTGVSGYYCLAAEHSHVSNPLGLSILYTSSIPNGTGNVFLDCGDQTTQRAAIRSNGGLANYSANDVNLSDRREKTNFAPAKSYLDTICAIPVQTFNYIDQSEDDPGLTLGVAAQDVQAVAPELVMESNWGTEEAPKQRLSIYQTDLQYALMKCIQELKAQNDELRARVAALESN